MRRWPLALILLPLAACQAQPLGGAGRRPPAAQSGPKASPAAPGLGLQAQSPRVVQGGVLRQVVGQVRVVTPWALGLSPEERVAQAAGRIISNNGGTLVSNHGAGLISDQGGGLISDQGGGIIGKTKFYELAQAQGSALPEDRLADAVVEVVDAKGQQLVDAEGKPLVAQSDASGAFRFSGRLPADETLVFRVRLAEGGELAGGSLMALVPPSLAPDQVLQLRLGTASTLGAAYVLSRFVKGEQGVLNRLPRQEAEALILDAEAARAALPPAVPAYESAALTASLEALLPKAPPLKATVERIASILLAGQQDLGAQAAASEVPLLTPKALALLPSGALLVAESVAGRVRALGADGRLQPLVGRRLEHFASEGAQALGAVLEGVDDMAVDPTGRLYLAEGLLNRVWRVGTDGAMALVLGAGAAPGAALPAPGPSVAIHRPRALALAPDGALWVGEARRPDGQGDYRLIRVAPDGQASAVPTPPQPTEGRSEGVTGLAFAPDGSLWMTASGQRGGSGHLWRRSPEGAWLSVWDGVDLGENGHLLVDGEGVYLSEYRTHKVWRVARDGAREVVAEGLRFPAGLARLASGEVAVAALGQHAVYRLPSGGGAPQRLVGVDSPEQVGQAQAIPVAAPGGLAYESSGALLFTEVAGATVKRLADGRIAQVGASGARFQEPSGVAVAPDGTLYVLETTGARLWRQRAQGPWEPVAGTGLQAQSSEKAFQRWEAARLPGLSRPLGRPVGLRMGPEGLPYWLDQAFGLVMRLAADGQVEVVAGRVPALVDQGGDEGDGGPPEQARFDRPNDLAIDAQGRLYVADTLNFRVRRIDLAAKQVSSVAGLSKVESLTRLLAGQTEGLLLGPASVAVGPGGELAVGTMGTTRLRGLAAAAGLSLPAAVPLVGAQVWFRAQEGQAWFPLAGAQGRVMEGQAEEALGVASNLAFSPLGGLALSDGLLNQIRLVPPSAWR